MIAIELDEEGRKSVELLLSQGRFSSIEDAVTAGLQSLLAEDAAPPWTRELQDAIDIGVEAARASRFASEEEIEALFASVQQKSA